MSIRLLTLGMPRVEVDSGERGPFDALTPAELTFAYVRTAPPRLDRYRKDAPGPVIDLMDRCLAKRPEHRPTMEEVLGRCGRSAILP